MLVATSMLHAPKAVARVRILPRTMPIGTIAFIIGTAVLGFLVATIFFGGLKAVLYGAAGGGAVGYMLTQWSPMEGEGFAAWAGLKAKSGAAKRVEIDGERCVRYIGFAPLRWTAEGPIHIVPGSIEVQATSWDERGYPHWGNEDTSRSTHMLLEKTAQGKKGKQLRAAAGVSLSDALARQEDEKKRTHKAVQKQLPSRRKKTPKQQVPSLQARAGSLTDETTPAQTSTAPKKKRPATKPTKKRAVSKPAAKKKAPKKTAKKTKGKPSAQQSLAASAGAPSTSRQTKKKRRK